MPDFYENDTIIRPVTNPLYNMFLSLDNSNRPVKTMHFIAGTETELAWCFQGDERKGAYSPEEGVLGFAIYGFPSFHFSIGQIDIINKSGTKLSLLSPALTADRTATFQDKSGTVALTSDLIAYTISKVNDEAIETIYPGMFVKLSGDTDCLLAQADSTSNYAFGMALDQADPTESLNIQVLGIATLSNWTNVVGSTNLTTNTLYFLSDTDPGMITATPPSNEQIVGLAVSPTQLLLRIN